MKQVSFDMGFTIEGKETVCGFKCMEDDKGRYVMLCASAGDYSREYELRAEGEGDECTFHFVTPDVPEDLKRHECEISGAIMEHLAD